jgi:hypothetical protein
MLAVPAAALKTPVQVGWMRVFSLAVDAKTHGTVEGGGANAMVKRVAAGFSWTTGLGLLTLLVVIIAWPSSAAAFEDGNLRLGLHDVAGVLSESERAAIRERVERVHAAGAPTVVYLRIQDASVSGTVDDAQALMKLWDVQSATGARDGIVLFFNLDVANPNRGSFAVIAGARHFRRGALPQAEIDRITNEMVELLARDGDSV